MFFFLLKNDQLRFCSFEIIKHINYIFSKDVKTKTDIEYLFQVELYKSEEICIDFKSF